MRILVLSCLLLAACTRPASEAIDPIEPAPSSPSSAAPSTVSAQSTEPESTSPSRADLPRPSPTEAVAPTTPAPTSTIGPAPTTPDPSPSTTAVVDVPTDHRSCVNRIPVAWKAGQVLMPAVYGDRLAAGRQLVDDAQIGGLVLMTWPDGADATDLLALRNASSVPLLMATDEEGGNVQRLRGLGRIPSQRDVAISMTVEQAEAMIATHADRVRQLGIDMVFAPVVDVGDAPPIGSRAFGNDPAVVTAYAQAYVRGWHSAGITPVLKHFPGHGKASADTHDTQASTPPLDQLLGDDLVPYANLAGTPNVGVMVGHLDVPGLTDDDGLPASLSPAAIGGLLRNGLGYGDALVVTDALGMGAVGATHGLSDASVLALAAGADIVLFTSSSSAPDVRSAIIEAVDTGRLAVDRLDDAVDRILRRKGIDACDLL